MESQRPGESGEADPGIVEYEQHARRALLQRSLAFAGPLVRNGQPSRVAVEAALRMHGSPRATAAIAKKRSVDKADDKGKKSPRRP